MDESKAVPEHLDPLEPPKLEAIPPARRVRRAASRFRSQSVLDKGFQFLCASLWNCRIRKVLSSGTEKPIQMPLEVRM